MVYRGAYAVVLVLHLLTVVFLIGPLAVTTMTAPRLVRGGREALPGLRAALRTTRLYSVASVLTVVLGTAMIGLGDAGGHWDFADAWIDASYALWLIATLLTILVVGRGIAATIEAVQSGGDGRPFAGRITAAGGIAVLCWTAIVVLMVVKPGA